MQPQIVFQFASTLVLPAWFLLIVFPSSRITQSLVKRGIISVLLSVLYLGALILHRFQEPQQGGFGSLADIRLLFSSDWALLAGWIHYLAFDLFIGAQFAGLLIGRPFARTLILLLIFMFGPVGFLLALGATQKTQLQSQKGKEG